MVEETITGTPEGADAVQVETAQGAINNVGNIRTETWQYKGIIDGPIDTFLSFETLAHGYAAIITKLHYYYKTYKDYSLEKIISRYAPPTDGNDTENYINSVSAMIGKTRTEDLKDFLFSEQVTILARAISQMEQGGSFIADNADIINNNLKLALNFITY